MAAAQQAPMAMVVQDFDSYHPSWDPARAAELLEVSAGTPVRLLEHDDDAVLWRVEPVAGGRAGLVARVACLATSSGGKGDWKASKGTADATIAAAVEQGLTSDTFDLSENVANNDTRLVDPAVHAMEAIMERENCSFDEARNIYNKQKMREAGIDPETGLSLDPKAVTNPEDFERVFSEGASSGSADGLVPRAVARLAHAKKWWVNLVRIFGVDFVVFISLANFLFGVLGEWYGIFLSYYLKDDLGYTAAVSQAISATAGLAFQLRPVCGIVSDSFPVLGSTRHSWFFMSAMAAVASQALLLVVNNVTLTTVLLFLINFFGGTWVFVISGAMIAEVSRKDPVAGAENLQAVQWGFYALGMFCGDLTAGPLYVALCSARTCFMMSMLVYFALAFAPFTVEDTSATEDSAMSKLVSTVRNAFSCCPRLTCIEDDDDDGLTMDAARTSATTATEPSDEATAASSSNQSQGTALDQLRKVWRTVDPKGPTEGILLRPVVYIFLCVSCVPDYYYGATYYFYTSPPIVEANGCDGSVSTAVGCSALLLAGSGNGAGCAEEHWLLDTFGEGGALQSFSNVPWPQGYRPVAPQDGGASVMEWAYTGASADGCSSCEAFQLPAQESLCEAAGDCQIETLYEGTGCESIAANGGGMEQGMQRGAEEMRLPEGCAARRICARVPGGTCPSDAELEQMALSEVFRGAAQASGKEAAAALDAGQASTGLNAVGQVQLWLASCGDGQCDLDAADAPVDGYGYGYGGESDSGECTYSDGYGYGYGSGACAPIETARYFAVLSEGDNGACNLAVCNATLVDTCTEFQGGLGFEPTTWSQLAAIASLGSFLGTFIFASLLADSSLRRTFVGVHLALAFVGLADAILALRWNVAWGIEDYWFAGLDQFMYVPTA
jgi:hypothetical protein